MSLKHEPSLEPLHVSAIDEGADLCVELRDQDAYAVALCRVWGFRCRVYSDTSPTKKTLTPLETL